MLELQDGIRMSDKHVNYSHEFTKPNNKLVNACLEHFWCTDKPWAYKDSQDSSYLDLKEATTFPLIIFSMISHWGYIQMSFHPKTPKLRVPIWKSQPEILKIGVFGILEVIIFCVDL